MVSQAGSVVSTLLATLGIGSGLLGRLDGLATWRTIEPLSGGSPAAAAAFHVRHGDMKMRAMRAIERTMFQQPDLLVNPEEFVMQERHSQIEQVSV